MCVSYACMHLCVSASCKCVCVCVCLRVYVCIVCVYMYVCASFVCVSVCACVCMHHVSVFVVKIFSCMREKLKNMFINIYCLLKF